MKRCHICKESKDLSEFHKNRRRLDGLNHYCKVCARKKNREYYLKTPERNPQRRASTVAKQQIAAEFVWKYLLEHSCVDCPETDPVVLDFDHVSGDKLFNISYAVKRGFSIELIGDEIKKCEVRCANCHRRITASRAGWFRWLKGIEGSTPEDSTQIQCDDTGKTRTTV